MSAMGLIQRSMYQQQHEENRALVLPVCLPKAILCWASTRNTW